MTVVFLLFKLFYTFFIIGIFTFGGGYAMLSVIQGEVVIKHQWITESMFTDIVAISQTTPGPIGINSATYVGYAVIHEATGSYALGVLGSFTSTFAIVLPSLIIVFFLAKIYKNLANSPIFKGIMSALRPTIVGLISAAAFIMIFRIRWSGIPLFSSINISIIEENFPDIKSLFLFILGFIVSFKFKINPILIILGAGILGLLIY